MSLCLVAVPSGASAQSDNNCEVNVTESSQGIAHIDVDCGDEVISNVDLTTSENGEIEGLTATDCSGSGDTFVCNPTGESGHEQTMIEAAFTANDDDVCDLAINFSVSAGGETETFNDVGVEECGNSSASGGDEDDGDTPEGGVDSGAGGNARPDVATLVGPVPAAVALMAVLSLAGGLLVRRTRRGS